MVRDMHTLRLCLVLNFRRVGPSTIIIFLNLMPSRAGDISASTNGERVGWRHGFRSYSNSPLLVVHVTDDFLPAGVLRFPLLLRSLPLWHTHIAGQRDCCCSGCCIQGVGCRSGGIPRRATQAC